MAALTKAKLEEVLSRRLKLKSAEFRLEKLGDSLSGSVIADAFLGMDSLSRLRWMWRALDAEFGERARLLVGTLLPYTRAEWYVDLDGVPAPRRPRPVRTARRKPRATAAARR